MAGLTNAVLKKRGQKIVLVPRKDMCKRLDRKGRRFSLPRVPATMLPVDGTNNAELQCPIDGNDRYGDCMEAMACHVDNCWTYGMGRAGWTESTFPEAAIIQQYERASGGDNGLDEPTLLNNCWKPGLAGNPQASFVDSLDIDYSNTALMQFAIDQFFAVCIMWDVPNEFINTFDTGMVYDSPMRGNPANGHGTPLMDIDAAGRYRLWTWGSWCWVSAAFLGSVNTEAFLVFSARQFNPATGYDAKGRHIIDQAAKWQAAGGAAIPPAVLNSFPAPTPNPAPPAPPNPVPPAPPPLPPINGIVATLAVPIDCPGGNYVVVPDSVELAQIRAKVGLSWQQWVQLILAILTAIEPIINPPPARQ